MTPYLIVLAVIIAAGAFVLYRRGALPQVTSTKSTPGRLHQRAQEGERPSPRSSSDEFVDSQAAVWDTGRGAPEPRPALFVDDDVYDSSVEVPYDELPYADAVDDDVALVEDEVVVEEVIEDEVAYEEVVDEEVVEDEVAFDSVVAYDEDDDLEEPVVDRFAARPPPVRAAARPAPEPEPEPEPQLIVTSDGTSTLAKRTPKTESDSKRRPARLTQAQQRPTGVARRSPDQVRSMLTSYRGGLKKARDDDDPPT